MKKTSLRNKASRTMSIALAAMLAAASLIGCGGDAALTGTLVGPLAGVSYETTTVIGVTAEDGSFSYNEGETVRFFIGATELGAAEGQPEVTLFDFVDGAEPFVGRRSIGPEVFNRNRLFASVINRATLLSTFDDDGDASNGVQLTEAAAELFAAADIDFSFDVSRFARVATFRSVLNAANDASVFADHRRYRLPELAAAELYDWVGVDPELMTAVRTELDSNADGTFDSLTTRMLDEEGRFVHFWEDNDLDSMPERESRSNYDESGRYAGFESEENGVLRQSSSVERDADGNAVRSVSDDDGDGMPDRITTTEHDAWGRETRRMTDNDGDSVTDTIQTFENDERGFRIMEWSDDNADEMIDSTIASTYDERGLLTSRERDNDNDGIVDRRESNTYDTAGRTLERRTEDGAGVLQRLTVSEYDGQGRETAYKSDSDGDGMFDTVYTTVRDEDGNAVREEVDQDGDGMTDRVTLMEYDSRGYLTRQIEDSDNDTIADTTSVYTNDAFGNATITQTDNDGDGIIDEITTRVYASVGWIVVFD